MQREFREGRPAATTLPPPAPATQAPTQIGPYRILDTLGEGGMGTVYLAEQHVPVKRRIALKLIKLGMDSKAVVARFEQERQAARCDAESQRETGSFADGCVDGDGAEGRNRRLPFT